MENLINIDGTLFEIGKLRFSNWVIIDNDMAGCYCNDIAGNSCSVKSWKEGNDDKFMLISKNENKKTHYVSTTYNTTWMGSIESMQDDYYYSKLFYGTEEQCIAEMELRIEN